MAEIEDLEGDFAYEPKKVKSQNVEKSDEEAKLTEGDLAQVGHEDATNQSANGHYIQGKMQKALEDHIKCALPAAQANRPAMGVEFSSLQFSPGIAYQKPPIGFEGIRSPCVLAQQVGKAEHIAPNSQDNVAPHEGSKEVQECLIDEVAANPPGHQMKADA